MKKLFSSIVIAAVALAGHSASIKENAGTTNLPGTFTNVILSIARVPTVLTPFMFGASGNTNSNDAAAWQAAMNTKTNAATVIDGLGRWYLINSGMLNTNKYVTLQNFHWIVTNANLCPLTNQADYFTIRDCTIYGPGTNTVTGADPGPSSVGLATAINPLCGCYTAPFVMERAHIYSFNIGLFANNLERPLVSECVIGGNKTYGVFAKAVDSSIWNHVRTGLNRENIPGSFFPPNTVTAWRSNSVGFHFEAPFINVYMNSISGGDCKRAAEFVGDGIGTSSGITIVNAEIEDVWDYGTSNGYGGCVFYFTNCINVRFINPQMLRIGGPHGISNTKFEYCRMETISYDAGLNYDANAFADIQVWAPFSPDGNPNRQRAPYITGPARVILHNNRDDFAVTNYYEVGTIGRTDYDQYWRAVNTMTNSDNVFRGTHYGSATLNSLTATGTATRLQATTTYLEGQFITSGADAGGTPGSKSANVNKTFFKLRAPSYASSGDADPLLIGEGVASSSANVFRLGSWSGQSDPGLTEMRLGFGESVSGNSLDRIVFNVTNAYPLTAYSLGAGAPFTRIDATDFYGAFTGSGAGLTSANPTNLLASIVPTNKLPANLAPLSQNIGSSLTALTPANISSGTATISITGSARTLRDSQGALRMAYEGEFDERQVFYNTNQTAAVPIMTLDGSSSNVVFAGSITGNGSKLTNSISTLSLSSATNAIVDFSTSASLTLAVTTNVTIQVTNYSGGKTVKLLLTCDGTTRTLSFRDPVTPLGAALPGAIAAGKDAVLELQCWGGTAASVKVLYAEQP